METKLLQISVKRNIKNSFFANRYLRQPAEDIIINILHDLTVLAVVVFIFWMAFQTI